MLGVDLKSLPDRDYYASAPSPTKTQIKPGLLRVTGTGRGVKIGDSPGRVRQIMGRPSWKGGSRYVPGEKVWSYRWIVGKSDDGMGYRALFRFRNGKVSVIELNSDLLGGA